MRQLTTGLSWMIAFFLPFAAAAHAPSEPADKAHAMAECQELMKADGHGEMMQGHAGMMQGHGGMMGKGSGETASRKKSTDKGDAGDCMQMMQHGAKAHAASGGPEGQATRHSATGTVKSVDPEAGKVTLRHEPIQALGWPAMTMPFAVADKAALQRLKPGQKVEFEFSKQGPNVSITSIR